MTLPEFIVWIDRELTYHRPDISEDERRKVITAITKMVNTPAGFDAFIGVYNADMAPKSNFWLA